MWFRVDDGYHAHEKVLGLSLAARGLWITCGTWSADYERDGFVPVSLVKSLDAVDAAAELVEVGMWLEVESGWQFHDWVDFQTTREENDAKRAEVSAKRAAAGRAGGKRSAEARRAKQNEANRKQDPSKTEAKRTPDPDPDPDPETLVVTTTCLSSPNTRAHDDGLVDNSSSETLDGINVWAVQRAVAEHVGLDIDVFKANRLAGEIITRSLETVKRPTAYVVTAIKNQPGEIRAFLAEVAA